MHQKKKNSKFEPGEQKHLWKRWYLQFERDTVIICSNMQITQERSSLRKEMMKNKETTKTI